MRPARRLMGRDWIQTLPRAPERGKEQAFHPEHHIFDPLNKFYIEIHILGVNNPPQPVSIFFQRFPWLQLLSTTISTCMHKRPCHLPPATCIYPKPSPPKKTGLACQSLPLYCPYAHALGGAEKSGLSAQTTLPPHRGQGQGIILPG